MFNQVKQTIEDISNHADVHYAAVQSIPAGQAAPGQSGFCTVYTAARPILAAAAGVLFFIPKARGILQALVAGLDAFCSGNTQPTAMATSNLHAVPDGDAPTAQILN